MFHFTVPFVVITMYFFLCEDDITVAMVENPFKNKYYFTYSLLLHPLFNSPIPTHWHGPRLWLVNDLKKKSLSIQFCGSSSSIVSADVVHIKHGSAALSLLFVRLPIAIFVCFRASWFAHAVQPNTFSSCPPPILYPIPYSAF